MRVLGSLPKTIITPPSTSSSVRAFSLLIKPSSRLHYPTTNVQPSHHFRLFSSTPLSSMSFSNTTVPGDKPADPYKATNLTDPDLKEKVQDLVSFMESCKFGMMTTRIESSGLLTSRCMALAAKVGSPYPSLPRCLSPQEPRANCLSYHRKEAALTSSSTPIPNPAKRMISSRNPRSTLPFSIPPVNGPQSPAKPILSLTGR